MNLSSETLALPESTFAILRELIQQRLGLFFEPSRREMLAEKLSPRLIELGLNSFLDYYYLLRYDARPDEEWSRVMDLLSVPETFFWRESDQIRALVEAVVPLLIERGLARPLRIWSAACASGEEPLSIAMALNEAGWFERIPIEIYGSDASPAAIERARKGLYRERAFRNLAPGMREKYFQAESGGWRISPELHGRVQWRVANLMDAEAVAPLACAPVIFCRNVFLYFTLATIGDVVGRFYQCMPTPGFLFLGAAESLMRVPTHFNLEEFASVFVYTKR